MMHGEALLDIGVVMRGEHRIHEGKHPRRRDAQMPDQQFGGFALAHRADDKGGIVIEARGALCRRENIQSVAGLALQSRGEIGESRDRLSVLRQPPAHLVAPAVGADGDIIPELQDVARRTRSGQKLRCDRIHGGIPAGLRSASPIAVNKRFRFCAFPFTRG